MAASAIIEARALSFAYPDGNLVLSELDLSVEKGARCIGRIALHAPLLEIAELTQLRAQQVGSPLLRLVERWLRKR